MATQKAEPPRIPHAEYQGHLGSGGFADVYLYRQHMPERDIAVKVIRPDASAEENGAFEAEANLMAKMSAHPAILSVFGAGVSDDDRSYLIMEYCPPPHLGARARKQQFPVTTVLDIGIRIAGAVETLHRAGVLHRDIKPANILITQFGHPVLTDFGIAVSTRTHTQRADAGFSIPWAPPEQATGDGKIGPTLDVYSLAATLHTLLTGHSPFEIPGGDNREISLLNRVLRDPVPSTRRSDVPPELERILAIAMAKKPEQRYPSVLDFAQALQQIQEDMHQRTTPIDVLDDQVVITEDDSDDDATRVRAFTMIDATGPVTSPGATRDVRALPQDDATRAAIRNITAAQTPVDDATRINLNTPPRPAERWGDSDLDKTVMAQPAHPGGYPPPTPEYASAYTGVQTPPPIPSAPTPQHQETYSQNVEPQPQLITPHTPTPEPESAHAPQDEPHQPRSVGKIISIVMVMLVMVAVATFGAWTYLRNEGFTQTPDEKQSNQQLDGLPTEEKADAVTGLTGKVEPNGQVTFTWDAVPDGEYLFRVVDPLENHQIRQTKKPTVTIDKVDGRTCLEVFIRQPNGKTSERAIECVDTP